VTSLRRRLARHRRAMAALLLAASAVAGLTALAPARPASTDVVVAAHDLPAGQLLRPADLAVVELPVGARPDGTVASIAALSGRTVAAPLRRGEPVTDVRLVGPGLLAGSHGLVAAPVRVADADAAALVRPGDVIDVYAASGAVVLGDASLAGGDPSLAGGSSSRARLVAARARVLSVPLSFSMGDTRATTADGALLVLAVNAETARALAGAASAERLSLVIRSADDNAPLVR
jgi:pilus assembly protein CpaB